jgi:UDP:flavonoid glycosyltransferase YjiC (YdhE family)
LSFSYAEILSDLGYADADHLAGLIGAWMNLMAAVAPDMVIAEFAPTALLACRIRGTPAAAMGNGFQVPPQIKPLPGLQPWRPADPARLAASESKVVEVINDVLKRSGAPSIGALADLYAGAAPLIRSLPELDHYGARVGVPYLGSLSDPEQGAPAAWPELSGPKVFAYLTGQYKLFDRLVAVLADIGAPTLLHARDVAPERFSSLAPSLQIATRPVAVVSALADCDLVVCHGGAGLPAAALRAGRPIVAVPMHTEQALMAYRIHTQSLGVFVDAAGEGAQFADTLRAALDTKALRDNAAAVALRYRSHSRDAALTAAAEACERATRE